METANYPKEYIKCARRFWCAACSKFDLPGRKSVVSPNLRVPAFNYHVEMDILIPRKGVHILHIRDRWSRLSGATLLGEKGSNALVSAFIDCWLAFFGTPKIKVLGISFP